MTAEGVEKLPLAGYATLMGVFTAALAGFLITSRKSSKLQPADILLVGVATHKLSRLIAKDRVTAALRDPFVVYEGPADGSEVKQKPVGEGIPRAIGDLITCPWCMSPWVAAGLTYGMALQPEATRVVSGIFAAAAVSDFLHLAYDKAKEENK